MISIVLLVLVCSVAGLQAQGVIDSGRVLEKGQLIASLDDYELVARANLPLDTYDFIAGGGWNEITLRRERSQLDNITLYPRYLRDVSDIDTTKEVLGRLTDYPVGFSPIAGTTTVQPEGDIIPARACEELGNIYIQSHYSNNRIDEIARAAPHRCRKWLQLNPKANISNVLENMREAEKNGYEAILINLGLAYSGLRTRDVRNGFSRSNLPFALNDNENIDSYSDAGFGWDQLDILRTQTSLPVIPRLIINPLDAAEAIRRGYRGIFVSTYGGRVIDSVASPIEVLPAIMDIVKASGKKVDVYVDGGVRTGLDALKYYAYGVNMVFMGRPWMFAMAINGTGGAIRAFDTLTVELTNAMQLAGYPVLDEVEEALVHKPTREAAMQILRSPPPPSAVKMMKGQPFDYPRSMPNKNQQRSKRINSGRPSARDMALHRIGDDPLASIMPGQLAGSRGAFPNQRMNMNQIKMQNMNMQNMMPMQPMQPMQMQPPMDAYRNNMRG